MEALTLRYYLNLSKFIISIILIFIIYSFYILKIKTIFDEDTTISIKKNSSLEKISNQFTTEFNLVEKKLLLNFLKIYNYFVNIHYGEFILSKNSNYLEIIKKISQPSNVVIKIKIIEGWQKYQLFEYLIHYYEHPFIIKYEEILADTYFIKPANKISKLLALIKLNKNKLFEKYKNNKLLKKYSEKEIMIIASLVEKEGIDNNDKKKISSVILNRLDRGMKLQIDATTIYSLTEGAFKLDRPLTYEDLKIKHSFNTYYIDGLPPNPICFVGRKTIEIILENYKTNYLFYYYDKFENKHIYSENYKKHQTKLNVYRKKSK